ncbi:hypothetical protein M427DRAFT_59079 [Gonapodya prolifera JEL478]|uniref:F-box domain-containing protein n=1 Tax=Gonapodya prolifera (strain JEL478) TaxID=1344416 RepID=A0A139A8B0_GONPJ|nr:hypothetical protein M427DRAFT_59079 [Gonapodya prolifera JEL478]|eukprot:KXS12967.1 hypothetical protein M427DRAFT_59079 [Gonapodya prolifera JEL478]
MHPILSQIPTPSLLSLSRTCRALQSIVYEEHPKIWADRLDLYGLQFEDHQSCRASAIKLSRFNDRHLLALLGRLSPASRAAIRRVRLDFTRVSDEAFWQLLRQCLGIELLTIHCCPNITLSERALRDLVARGCDGSSPKMQLGFFEVSLPHLFLASGRLYAVDRGALRSLAYLTIPRKWFELHPQCIVCGTDGWQTFVAKEECTSCYRIAHTCPHCVRSSHCVSCDTAIPGCYVCDPPPHRPLAASVARKCARRKCKRWLCLPCSSKKVPGREREGLCPECELEL